MPRGRDHPGAWMSGDDREYWRQEDLRRERDREIWREQELRDEDRRHDRLRDEQHRADEVREAWRGLREGNTAWALRNMVGPDAALNYLNAMGDARAGAGEPAGDMAGESAGEPRDVPLGERGRDAAWPKHTFVRTLAELVENVEAAPVSVQFDVHPPDGDGDVLVRALLTGPFMDGAVGSLWTSLRGGIPYEYGKFWVRQKLMISLFLAGAAMERTHELLRQLTESTAE